MISQSKITTEVSNAGQKKFLLTVATLVTNHEQYEAMLESAIAAGFDRSDVNFIYIDNSSTNRFDGFSGINHFLNLASCEYLVICHQDILFEFDQLSDLLSKIQEVDNLDEKWGVLGNAGKRANAKAVARITDPMSRDLSLGEFPEKVVSLDENFLVINMKHRIGTTPFLTGFHLYGTDLCFNARQYGLNCYVIDFHLRHISAGKLDDSYWKIQRSLVTQYSSRKKIEVVQSMCSRFFISSSSTANKIFNNKHILNLHKSILKKAIK